MGTSFSSLLKMSNLHWKMDARLRSRCGANKSRMPPAEALKPDGGAAALIAAAIWQSTLGILRRRTASDLTKSSR